MPRLYPTILTFATLAAGLANAADPKPLPAPTVFAPGEISGPANDGAPTFSPDGKTLLFERSNLSWTALLESHLENGHWSKPAIASFAGPQSDQQPTFSPDGKYAVYVSSRAHPASKEPGAPMVRDSHLYRVDRTAKGWGTPVELPATVNITTRVFKPSIAANGDLYFMSDEGNGAPGEPKWRLYRSANVKGVLQQAVPLSFSDGSHPDVDAFIAPDQSYIVFSSKGRREPNDQEHLFLSVKKGNAWGPVIPIRYDGDQFGGDDGEAQVSPDGKTLYFTSGRPVPMHASRTRAQMEEDFQRLELWDNGNSNVWSLPLAPYLEAAAHS